MLDNTLRQQIRNTTAAGRNLVIIRDVRRHFERLGVDLNGLKILSFGCSSGEEALDLASVFPEAKIYGTDLSEDVLAQAREKCPPEIEIFLSTESALAQHGPSDAIFAMSVFCVWPKTEKMTDIAEIYPFSSFETGIKKLDSLLVIGGILTLYNAQYLLDDTSVAGNYAALERSNDRLTSGFIFKCTTDGKRATTLVHEFDGKIYSREDWKTLTDQDPNFGKDESGKAAGRQFHRWDADQPQAGRLPDVVMWRKQAQRTPQVTAAKKPGKKSKPGRKRR